MSMTIAKHFKLSPSRTNEYKRCEEKLHEAKFRDKEDLDTFGKNLTMEDVMTLEKKNCLFCRRNFNTTFPMVFGKAGHLIFEKFFKKVTLADIPADGNVYEMVYRSTLHLAPRDWQFAFEPHCRNFATIEDARWKRLGKFCGGDVNLQFSYWKPLLCEYEVEDEQFGLNFIVDRVEKVPPGYFRKDSSNRTEYCVTDYKTGRSYGQMSTDNRRQLYFYAKYLPTYVPKILPREPLYGSIIYTADPIRVNSKFFPQTKTAFDKTIQQINRSIIEKTWRPSLSRKYACKWCDYFWRCWTGLGFQKIYQIKSERRKEKEVNRSDNIS